MENENIDDKIIERFFEFINKFGNEIAKSFDTKWYVHFFRLMILIAILSPIVILSILGKIDSCTTGTLIASVIGFVLGRSSKFFIS